MVSVLRFKLEILAVRFKIKGFFNIASLFLAAAGFLALIKIIQAMLGNYEQLSVLTGSFIYIFFCRYIFTNDFEKKCRQMHALFSRFAQKDIKKYYRYKNLAFFWLAALFILWPVNAEDVKLFIFYVTVLNFLLFIQILTKNKFSAAGYANANLFIRIILCGSLILYLKNYQYIDIKNIVNGYVAWVCVVLNIFLVIEDWKLMDHSAEGSGSAMFVKLSQSLFLFNRNSDALAAVRKNMLIEPLMMVICGNIVIKNSAEDFYGRIFILAVSYLCSYAALYRLLIKEEEGKVIYFYPDRDIKALKSAKINHTVFLSFLLFLLTLAPLLFLVPLKGILAGYVISLCIFAAAASVVKIEAEKSFTYTALIKDKNILFLTGIQIFAAFFVCCILPNISELRRFL